MKNLIDLFGRQSHAATVGQNPSQPFSRRIGMPFMNRCFGGKLRLSKVAIVSGSTFSGFRGRVLGFIPTDSVPLSACGQLFGQLFDNCPFSARRSEVFKELRFYAVLQGNLITTPIFDKRFDKNK